MSAMDTELDQSLSISDEEISELLLEQQDKVKQFKASVFKPFWRSPHLHKNSHFINHFKHALRTLNGYDSDNIKRPFSFSPTWGLMLQHFKIQGDSHYTLSEFLKVITYKKFIVDEVNNEKKVNLDRNYCLANEAIKHNGDLSQIENRIGLLDFPYFINIIALLCVQASLKLHELSTQKKQDAKIYFNNTSPILDFLNNIHQRIHGHDSHFNLQKNIAQFYRVIELIFNYSIRLIFELLAYIITPFWDLAKLIIAPVILTLTFAIWYPISCNLYKNQNPPIELDDPPTEENVSYYSENLDEDKIQP